MGSQAGPHAPAPPRSRSADFGSPSGDHVVLDGIDLSVPAGSVFGTTRPERRGQDDDGADRGELAAANAGDIRVAGHDIVREPMAVCSVIGVTGQFSATDAYLSAEENLLLMADLSHLTKQQGRERSAELLRLFDLADTGRKAVFDFSLDPCSRWSNTGIVPTSTMPTGLRYFAEYQPFTPMINTLRGLLLGTPSRLELAHRLRLVRRARPARPDLVDQRVQPPGPQARRPGPGFPGAPARSALGYHPAWGPHYHHCQAKWFRVMVRWHASDSGRLARCRC